MIYPDIFNFSPPSSHLTSSITSIEKIPDLIQANHQFNHLVCITLPDCFQIPDSINTLLTQDCQYYKVKQLALAELIKPIFVLAFVKKGKLLAISEHSNVHAEDGFAFSEQGLLTLTLHVETYQKLGLEGKACANNANSRVVNVNVVEESFVPNKKNYERVKSRLETLNLSFDVILSWEPNDESVCPSSIAQYLSNAGYEIEVCDPALRTIHKYDTKIPDLISNTPRSILEWLGAVALDCDMSKIDVDAQDELEVPTLAILGRGFYSRRKVQELFQALITFMKKSPVRWVSLHVQDFAAKNMIHARDRHSTILIDAQLNCSVHAMIS